MSYLSECETDESRQTVLEDESEGFPLGHLQHVLQHNGHHCGLTVAVSLDFSRSRPHMYVCIYRTYFLVPLGK